MVYMLFQVLLITLVIRTRRKKQGKRIKNAGMAREELWKPAAQRQMPQ